MAEMVGSAVVQEAVSRVSSFMFDRPDEKVSQGLIVDRLEIALSELELALERSAKLPITDVALLRRRRLFKWAYIEGMHLLNRYKRGATEGQDTGQGVIRFSNRARITRPKFFCIPSFVGLNKDGRLSSSDVRRFEYFADCAGKFVRDVESGCSLRHHTFCSPLVRQLLQGKTIGYQNEMVQGIRLRECYIWPICFEERGVEALLSYVYEDRDAPEKCFNLLLMLRLSESTDIFAIATRCLHSLASLFNIVTESAIRELTHLPIFQDITGMSSYSSDTPDVYARLTQSCRRDPVCCRANAQQIDTDKMISLEASHKFEEGLIIIVFECYVSAQEYSLHNSSANDAATDWPPPLKLTASYLPHVFPEEQQDFYAMEVMGGIEERRDGSIQQMAETVRSKAISSFVRQAELRDYRMTLLSGHAAADFSLRKSRTEMAMACVPKLNSTSRTRRAAKKRR